MPCDGILGMDFLRRIGANLDLSTGKLFSHDNVYHVESRNIDDRNRVDRCMMHESGFQSQAAETIEHSGLSPDASDNVPMTLHGATTVWCVATTRDIPLPPMSEVLIQGRLKVATQKKVLALEEVIIEPVSYTHLDVYKRQTMFQQS